MDSNGDGVGDLRGLIGKLDYLAALGVTCLWLLPFYPSPWRDDGYDITDHCGVHPDLGTLGDVVALIHGADDRGMRVIVDLVLNHTSDQHPWFRLAREGHRRFRDYYVWADRRPPDAEKGIVFPGVQTSTWSFDRKARRYYFHRFYDFQPDLNIANPDVREEMERIIGFWIQIGVAGFRMDAVPFVVEPAGAEGPSPGPRFEWLHQFRNLLSWRRGDAVLLGEANVERDQIEDYFEGGGMHMLFNFTANQALWLSLAREDGRPLVAALQRTAGIPASDQWANFLRNHDELDLGRLAPDERADTFEAFGPDPTMQLYGRGIRRRLAPMLGGDRRRMELAFSLLLTMPGTPVLYSGDEIGMGDDLSLPEREPIRRRCSGRTNETPGFRPSLAPARSGPWSHVATSATGGSTCRTSFATRTRSCRGCIVRWECDGANPSSARGDWQPVPTGHRSLVCLKFGGPAGTVLAVHNLGRRAQPRAPLPGRGTRKCTRRPVHRPTVRTSGRRIRARGGPRVSMAPAGPPSLTGSPRTLDELSPSSA
jgi:maltose alpha-D-glucosyltransferase/alpha-amylase